MRWKAICAYDGTDFYGWQSQVGQNTFEDILDALLTNILKTKIKVYGSGRTDAGVHAKGQVFHFDADWRHSEEALLRALNTKLPEAIQVRKVQKAPDDFHARFSAKGKRYVYSIYEGYADPLSTRTCWSVGRKLDVSAMQEAARGLIGCHDFTAFSATRRDGKKADPVKELYRLDIIERGKKLRFIMEGDGFLYKMARSIAGALVEVGRGALTSKELQIIFKSKQRTRLVVTAPAKGLVLEKVFY